MTINNGSITVETTRTFREVYTSVPFTNGFSIDSNTVLFLTKEDDVNTVSCVLLNNTVETIVEFVDGVVEYEDYVDSGAISPYSDYTMIGESMVENASVVKISDNKVLITYTDSFTNYGIARIANISGKSITYGDEFVFNEDETSNISVQLLSNNRVFIAFSDVTYNSIAKFVVGTINGNDIVFGDHVLRQGDYVYGNNIGTTLLSDNKVFIAYEDGTCQMVTVASDNTMTLSTDTVFEDDGSFDNINATTIDSNTVLLVYKNVTQTEQDNLYDIKAKIANISVDTITFGANTVIHHSEEDFDGTTCVTQTDSGRLRFLVSINSQGILGTINVDTETSIITTNKSSDVIFNSHTNMSELMYIGDDKYLLLYSDGFSGNGVIVNVDGTNITLWEEYIFDNQVITSLDAIYMGSNKVFMVLNEVISDYSTSLATMILVNNSGNAVSKYNGEGKPNGIAKTSGVPNEIIDIYVPGNIQQ